MAKLLQRATVQAEIIFTVSEAEARALDALVGYGDDAFVKVFYEKLGKHYMHPHEKALREFFRSVREMVPPILSRIDDARAVFVSPNPNIAINALRKAEYDAREAARVKAQAPASCDERPQAEDPKGLSPKGASAVGVAETPKSPASDALTTGGGDA